MTDHTDGSPIVALTDVHFSYGDTTALAGVSFEVPEGSIFGLLGPNGGGKTTLFRILSTLFTPASGQVEVLGRTLTEHVNYVRRNIGVVFQSPSLDPKLTVHENLLHHGLLYGLSGPTLKTQIEAELTRLGVGDRAGDMVETLSGGLARRVELAKGLLTAPRLLILDEPSTGLDPGARRDLWQWLEHLRREQGTTILVTTHLAEEAEHCDRLAILDQGKVIVEGTPEELRQRVGGEVIYLRCGHPEKIAEEIARRYDTRAVVVDGQVRLEVEAGHRMVQKLYEELGDEVEQIVIGRPTLEDVFVHETGHRFWGN